MSVTTKFIVIAVTTKFIVIAVMTKLVLTAVTTKLVITAVTTKLLVLLLKNLRLGQEDIPVILCFILVPLSHSCPLHCTLYSYKIPI